MLNHHSILSLFLPPWMVDTPDFMAVCSIDRMQKAVGARILYRQVLPKCNKNQRIVMAKLCIRMQTFFDGKEK